MTQHFAVIGNPIDHSLSPVIHQLFAKQFNISLSYKKIKADEQCFEQQLALFFSQKGMGLNVTSPFKYSAYTVAEYPTLRCKQARAANTLWMSKNQLHADNTDGIGLLRDLSRLISLEGKRVLIVGAGGAARGIIYPLLQEKLRELVITNRTFAKAADLQHSFPLLKSKRIDELDSSFDLIINATLTSLTEELIELPLECYSQKPLCYDLFYKLQGTTLFVQHAQDSGCKAVDGLGMLVEQAAESFFIWHGLKPDTEEVLKHLHG